ncbi:hypothetical protein [Chelativorans sp. YIM 93263]|uniref:hypothetical protein n=1 Tax=Chelativorans sp. YIM 93263 TaxID=2906648 RepID=UPI002379CE61|nr:hypothetical protein [Chelativorans sp. YIM 93263]
MQKWATRMVGKLRAQPNSKELSADNAAGRGSRHMTQLDHYLAFYESRECPGYAVFITGEWGIGKTFQVKRAIPDDRCYYVSLFGMQSASEIFAAVFASMFPATAKRKADADSHKDVSALGFPIGALNWQLENIFIRDKVETDRVIIFDDLERCKIKPTDLLGVINRYVEHHKCRVIVIAHDGKLPKKLLEQQEKIFGQVIKVIPEVEAAYTEFAKEFGNGSENDPLFRFREDLVSLFKESQVGSLRILRHVMEDTVRLYNCLLEEQRNHPEATREIIRLVAALDFEARAMRIKPEDIRDRVGRQLIYEMERRNREGEAELPEPAFVTAQNRYQTVQLESTLLSDGLLQEILFEGVYDAKRIAGSVAASVYFANPTELPSWRVFIEFQSQPDNVAEAAKTRMEQEFRDREVLEPGEMLHVFALRLMMAQNDLLPESPPEIAAECRAYIDDLRAANRLKPTPMTWDDREDLSRAYAGYGYWVEEPYRAQFEGIFGYLSDERKAVMLDQLKDAGPGILHLVETDGETLYSRLNHTAKGGATYADVPVLAEIQPADFVASWMRSHPKNWYWIQNAISARLRPAVPQELSDELAWVDRVVLELEAEAQRANGIRALRIRRHLPRNPTRINEEELQG